MKNEEPDTDFIFVEESDLVIELEFSNPTLANKRRPYTLEVKRLSNGNKQLRISQDALDALISSR